MRLATPRSTPRDDDPNHYLRVIVGMLYVSQGSAGELLRGWWRWCGRDERWRESSARGEEGRGGGGRQAQDGWRCSVAARAYIARTNPNGNSSLGGASPIMHTPGAYPVARLLSSISPLVSLSRVPALSRFYLPISFVTFVSSLPPSFPRPSLLPGSPNPTVSSFPNTHSTPGG